MNMTGWHIYILVWLMLNIVPTVGLGCLRTSVLTTQNEGITHLGADLPLIRLIADDAGSI